MACTDDTPVFQKQGFLNEEFRLFHLRDESSPPYDFHYHDFLKIMVLLSGKVTYVIEGRSYPLAPLDMVLVDKGQIHRPEADPSVPYERVILYLSPAFMSAHSSADSRLDTCFSTAGYRHSQVVRLKEDARRPLLALLTRLEESVYRKNRDFAAPLYSSLLCLEFLVELNRACLTSDSQYIPTGSLDYRVSGLITYINDHLNEDLNISLLASCCYLSPYHMMRLFKEQTGCTIGNYITEKRLMKARSLLAEGTGATQVCFLCGFKNYSSFLKAYKKRFQELPKRKKTRSL